MAKNAALGFAGLVLMAASILFLLFLILPGVVHSQPFRSTYFLQADTSGITGAHDTTQWTYFYFCGPNNEDCGKAHPAPPFGEAWAPNAKHVPSQLFGSFGGRTTSKTFYYLWRFGWVFYIISFFFVVVAFFASFLACCGRLGSALASSVAALALFCLTIACSLMTATFVLARNHFHSAGRAATIGRYAFGWSWGAWAALLIATVLFCLGIRGDGGSSGGGGGRRWRRRHTTNSRSYGGPRVKDDYS